MAVKLCIKSAAGAYILG